MMTDMRSKNIKKILNRFVEQKIEDGIDTYEFIKKYNVIDSIDFDTVKTVDDFEEAFIGAVYDRVDIYYYEDAMRYLMKYDDSLLDSMYSVYKRGMELPEISSCQLATYHLIDRMIDEIDNFIEVLTKHGFIKD